eukprot:403349221
MTLKDLYQQITERHKENKEFNDLMGACMIAVNDEYIYELGTYKLIGTEEVAVIPPISGG